MTFKVISEEICYEGEVDKDKFDTKMSHINGLFPILKWPFVHVHLLSK